MGLFSGPTVIEWEEFDSETIFWKWPDTAIRKGSCLVIRAGQDAIFMVDGKIEGIFQDEGSYDVESDIVPVLSTLKNFRFSRRSDLRAEVLFVNTKEFTVKWGTRGAITIPVEGLPGGLPIRAFGTFQCRVCDYIALIDQVAGVRQRYTIQDVRERVTSCLDPLLMKWVVQAGKDIFHLQASSNEIAGGICQDLDMQMRDLGIAIDGFAIQNVSYPEDVQEIARQAIRQNFTGQRRTASAASGGAGLNFCPNCGAAVGGANFCPNCGQKLRG